MKRLSLIFGLALSFVGFASAAYAGDPIYLYPSGGDDQGNIQNAINIACAQGNTDVVLTGGTYNINGVMMIGEPYNRYTHFMFNSNCSNVGLRGNDGEVVRLIYQYIANGILIDHARDIRIENLEFDWLYHPFGQGTVYSINANTKTVWVVNDYGYALWNHPIFAMNGQGIFLARTNRGNTPQNCHLLPTVNTPSGFANSRNFFNYSNDATVFRGTLTDPSTCPAGLRAGDKVVLIRGSWETNGIHMVSTAGAMLKNLTFYSAPGLGILNEHSEPGTVYSKINMIGIVVAYHPTDTSRTLTVNSNPIMSTGSRAALYIADSLFYGQGDDAIDMHTRGANFINYFHDGTNMILQMHKNFSMDRIRTNEVLEIFNPKTGQYRCEVTALAPSYDCGSGGECVAVTAAPCQGMISYWTQPETNADGTSDWIVNENETWDAVNQVPTIIENNLFYGSRGRGILNRGTNTIIRNNDIGDPYYGGPNFDIGIYEAFCSWDIWWGAAGRWNWPGRDNQQIYGNYGTLNDRVQYCIASDYTQWWPY